MKYKKVVITEDQLRLIYDVWQKPCNVRLILTVYRVKEYDHYTDIQIIVTSHSGLKTCYLEYANSKQEQYIFSFAYTDNSYDTFANCISKILSSSEIQERIKRANTSGMFEEDREIQIMTYKNSLDEHGNIVLKEGK